MSVRTVAAGAAAVLLMVGLAAATLVAPVLWLVVDETAVPPASALPRLPAGVTADHQGVSCGSGGCWREWTLLGLSDTVPQSGNDPGSALGLPAESCVARSLLDRREVCTSVLEVTGETRLIVQYDRPWG